MILETIYELTILGVADVGIPNQERIIIRPTQAVNLAGFGLYLGQLRPDGMIVPFRDHFFWFGEIVVTAPGWIIVYTGPGEFQVSQLPGTKEPAYSFHWGKQTTILGAPNIVPALFRFDGISIGPQPQKFLPTPR